MAVEDEVHLTVDKFLDTLKRTFGSGRTANYYRGQLSIIHKKPAEHILDYIGRIKDMRTAIIEGDQTNFDRRLTEPEIASIDALALESFYEGLPREYRVELRAEGYINFADACTKVITISKRLEREEARERQARNTRTIPTTNHTQILNKNSNSQNNSNTLGSTEQRVCGYCKRLGHLIHECRTRQYHINNNTGNNSSNYNRNSNYNQDNNNNFAPKAGTSGNEVKASAIGTSRGLGNPSPIHMVENHPHTSSEMTTETFPL